MRQIFAILALLICGFSQAAFAGSERFQPGDTLQISVWQEPKLDRQVIIAPDGSIDLPLVGIIKAGGRSAGQVKKSIKARLSRTYKGDLDVTVSFIGRPGWDPEEEIERNIYVMGEVTKPGPFIIKTRTTILQALALGGGLSPFAADKRIQVHRKVKGVEEVYEFNYRNFERGIDPSGNISLRPGDVVVVPERGLFE